MQMTTDQKTTLNLIRIAQDAASEDVRSTAVNMLWDIYGAKVMGISNKHSLKADADWDLRGLSPANRQREIMYRTFLMFRRAVLNYDTHTNVPFMAYVANSSKFQQKTEKRQNAKHTDREVPVDFSGNTREEKYGDNPQMLRDLAILKKTDHAPCQEIEDIEIRDAFEGIERFLNKNTPKLLPFYRACCEICQEYGDFRDVYVADRLDYTRANVGVLRKKLCAVLTEAGLDEEYRLVIHALAETANRIDEFRTVYLSRAA